MTTYYTGPGIQTFSTSQPPQGGNMSAFSNLPLASIITVILAVVGGITVITNPDTLSFDQYLTAMAPLIGLVAIGRGVHENGKARAGK